MKRNTSIPYLIWASLVVIVLMALQSFVENGNYRYVGKSYVESDDFQQEMENFYTNFSTAILNPVDLEAAKKNIIVTSSEIEDHRTYYGTLSEQVDNIEEQYAERIADAEAAKKENLKKTLVEERDAKITDIRKNFESDAHVEAKIRADKERQLEQEWKDHIRSAKEQLYFPVAYELTDIQSGETFKTGDISVAAGYKKTFNKKEGYLRATPYPTNDFDYDSYPSESVYEWGDSVFSNQEVTVATTSNHSLNTALESGQPQAVKRFEGTVIVPKSAMKEGQLGRNVDQYNRRLLGIYTLGGLGLLALLALASIMRFKKEWVTKSSFASRYDRLKLDLKVALLILSAMIVWGFTFTILHRYTWFFFQYSIENGLFLLLSFVALVFLLWATVFQLVLLVERLKNVETLEQEIRDSYSVKFLKALQGMFLNRKMGAQTFILLIGFFLAGIGFVGMFLDPFFVVIYTFCVLFLGLPALYIFVKRAAYLNRILVATEAMANGRLNEDIKVVGKSPLAEHAKNLNNLREGVRVSMTEQAKSERLKTELITNVSHDLRTPLTSIITYTDLLKNEELSSEERSKYVDILDKKSQRLKTLIEDLFEVSKMASGNLELHKQRVDLTQLLQQALAEHEEEISKSGLDFRVNSSDSPLIAYVDGQRWWRVLDNLIVNSIKYTLQGTRVYITLRKVGDTAEFVVKNITKYELGDNTDELFERFKRADTSRHTDGSGLGLAIAQSIVDMHNGNMKIEVDGDLFKVTVVVAAI